MGKKVSDFDVLCKPLFKLKGVEKSTSYNTPAVKIKKKLLVRLREDNSSIVIRIDPEDREKLLRDRPEVFFLEDHYENYPYILAHLSTIQAVELFDLVKHQVS